MQPQDRALNQRRDRIGKERDAEREEGHDGGHPQIVVGDEGGLVGDHFLDRTEQEHTAGKDDIFLQ